MIKGEWFDFIFTFCELLPGLVTGVLGQYLLCGVDITEGIIIGIFCIVSLWFRSWKDFNSGWWNELTSAWFPDVCHFETFTQWIQFRLDWCDLAWKATNGNLRKFTKLSVTIFSKFLSWDCYPICIHGSWVCWSRHKSLRKLLTYIIFSRATHGLSFLEHKHMWKLPNLSSQLWKQCFINPWIPTALFLIITAAVTSAAVS